MRLVWRIKKRWRATVVPGFTICSKSLGVLISLRTWVEFGVRATVIESQELFVPLVWMSDGKTGT